MKRATRRSIRNVLPAAFGAGYYLFGILVSVAASRISSWWWAGSLILVGILFASGAYYYDSGRRRRRLTDQKLEPLLTDLIFPMIRDEYEEQIPDSPEVRVNVMLLRRRDVVPFGNERKLWPWQRSLKVDFANNDYSEFGEESIKWAIDEGICGTVIEYNRMIHSDLEDVEIHEWDMTESQMSATRHLGSVLSIPIYIPEDEEKNHPIGVLNLDSRANLAETRFNSGIGKELKKYANYIGTLA